MPITIFIEIAIGIVFVWLFLALAVMAVREWWDALFKTRAKDMQKILRGMLEDPTQLQNTIKDASIVQELYKHPQIQALSQPVTSKRLIGKFNKHKEAQHQVRRAFEVKVGERSSWRWLPSYIPTKTFALALYDVIATAGTEKSVIRDGLADWQEEVNTAVTMLRDERKLPPETLEKARQAVSDLKTLVTPSIKQSELSAKINAKVAEVRNRESNEDLAKALNALKPLIDELPQYLLSPEVSQGIAKLVANNSAAKGVLEDLHKRAISAAAQGEERLGTFRANIENWFDNTMARAGGWYKRRAQRFAIICGFLIAAFLNVDSLAVVRALYKEPTLRAAVVAEAGSTVQGEVEDQNIKAKEVSGKLQELGLPVGWRFAEAKECKEIDTLGNWSLDVGGTRCFFPADTPQGIAAANLRQGTVFWVLKVIGWGFSGAMAMQGAPFWFDILKRLVNVRSAGQKPEEVEEKKKGKKGSSEGSGNG